MSILGFLNDEGLKNTILGPLLNAWAIRQSNSKKAKTAPTCTV